MACAIQRCGARHLGRSRLWPAPHVRVLAASQHLPRDMGAGRVSVALRASARLASLAPADAGMVRAGAAALRDEPAGSAVASAPAESAVVGVGVGGSAWTCAMRCHPSLCANTSLSRPHFQPPCAVDDAVCVTAAGPPSGACAPWPCASPQTPPVCPSPRLLDQAAAGLVRAVAIRSDTPQRVGACPQETGGRRHARRRFPDMGYQGPGRGLCWGASDDDDRRTRWGQAAGPATATALFLHIYEGTAARFRSAFGCGAGGRSGSGISAAGRCLPVCGGARSWRRALRDGGTVNGIS
jgi:hypothetical protein